jgi:hypothetical protein
MKINFENETKSALQENIFKAAARTVFSHVQKVGKLQKV